MPTSDPQTSSVDDLGEYISASDEDFESHLFLPIISGVIRKKKTTRPQLLPPPRSLTSSASSIGIVAHSSAERSADLPIASNSSSFSENTSDNDSLGLDSPAGRSQSLNQQRTGTTSLKGPSTPNNASNFPSTPSRASYNESSRITPRSHLKTALLSTKSDDSELSNTLLTPQSAFNKTPSPSTSPVFHISSVSPSIADFQNESTSLNLSVSETPYIPPDTNATFSGRRLRVRKFGQFKPYTVFKKNWNRMMRQDPDLAASDEEDIVFSQANYDYDDSDEMADQEDQESDSEHQRLTDQHDELSYHHTLPRNKHTIDTVDRIPPIHRITSNDIIEISNNDYESDISGNYNDNHTDMELYDEDDDDIPIHRKRVRTRIAVDDENSQENQSDPFEGIPENDRAALRLSIRKAKGSMPASHFIQDYWRQQRAESPDHIPQTTTPIHSIQSHRIGKGIATIRKSIPKSRADTLRNFIDDSSQPEDQADPYHNLQEHASSQAPHLESEDVSNSDFDSFDEDNPFESRVFNAESPIAHSSVAPRITSQQTEPPLHLRSTGVVTSAQPSAAVSASSLTEAREYTLINRLLNNRTTNPLLNVRDFNQHESLPENEAESRAREKRRRFVSPARELSEDQLDLPASEYPVTPNSPAFFENQQLSGSDSELEVLDIQHQTHLPAPQSSTARPTATRKQPRPAATVERRGPYKSRSQPRRRKELKGTLPPSYVATDAQPSTNARHLPSARNSRQQILDSHVTSSVNHSEIQSDAEEDSNGEFANSRGPIENTWEEMYDNDGFSRRVLSQAQESHQTTLPSAWSLGRSFHERPEINPLTSSSGSASTVTASRSKSTVQRRSVNTSHRRTLPTHSRNPEEQSAVASDLASKIAPPQSAARSQQGRKNFGRIYVTTPNRNTIIPRRTGGTIPARDIRVDRLVQSHAFRPPRHRKRPTQQPHNVSVYPTRGQISNQIELPDSSKEVNPVIEDWFNDIPSEAEDPYNRQLSDPSSPAIVASSPTIVASSSAIERPVVPIRDAAEEAEEYSEEDAIETISIPMRGVVSAEAEFDANMSLPSRAKPDSSRRVTDFSHIKPLSSSITFDAQSFITTGVLEAVITGVDPNPLQLWVRDFDEPLGAAIFPMVGDMFFAHMEKFYGIFLDWYKTPSTVTQSHYAMTYDFLSFVCRFIVSNISGFNETNASRFLRELRTFMENCFSLGLTRRPSEMLEKISITCLTFSIAMVMPLFASIPSVRFEIIKPIFQRFGSLILSYLEKSDIFRIVEHSMFAQSLERDQYYLLELAAVLSNTLNKASEIQATSDLPTEKALADSLYIFGMLEANYSVEASAKGIDTIWKSFFTYLPLLRLKNYSPSNPSLDWKFVIFLVGHLLDFISRLDRSSVVIVKGSHRFSKYLSESNVDCLHSSLSILLSLMDTWGWDGNKDVIKSLFGFFFDRDFYNVEQWHVVSPLKLTTSNDYSYSQTDSCFAQYLKLYANTVQNVVNDNGNLSVIHEINVVKVFSYHREDELQEADLEALENMYAFLLLRHKLAPLKLRLPSNQLSEFVNPRALHADARYSVLKAWNAFMEIQAHKKGGRFLTAKDWFYSLFGYALKEYLILMDYFKDRPSLLKRNIISYTRFFCTAIDNLKHWLSVTYITHKDWRFLLSTFFAKKLFGNRRVPQRLFELYFPVLESYASAVSAIQAQDFSPTLSQSSRDKDTILKEVLEWLSGPDIFTFKRFVSLVFDKENFSRFSDKFISKAMGTYTICAELLISNTDYSWDKFIGEYNELSATLPKSKDYFPYFLASILDHITQEQYLESEMLFLQKWMEFLVSEDVHHEGKYSRSLLRRRPTIFSRDELESLVMFVETFSLNRASVLKIVIGALKRAIGSSNRRKIELGEVLLSTLTSGLVSVVSHYNSKAEGSLLYLDSLQRIMESFPSINHTEVTALLSRFESKTEKIISNLKTKLTNKAFVRSSHHQHILNIITKKRDDYFEIFFKAFSSSFREGVYTDDFATRSGRDIFLKFVAAPYFIASAKPNVNQIIFLPPLSEVTLRLVEFQASSNVYYPRQAVSFLLAAMLEYITSSPLVASTSSSTEDILLAIAWKTFRTVLGLAKLQLLWINDLVNFSEELTVFSRVLELGLVIYGKHFANIYDLSSDTPYRMKDSQKAEVLKDFYSSTSESGNFRFDGPSSSWSFKGNSLRERFKSEYVEKASQERAHASNEVYRFFREIYLMNDTGLNRVVAGHQRLIQRICSVDGTLQFMMSLISQNVGTGATEAVNGNSLIDSLLF